MKHNLKITLLLLILFLTSQFIGLLVLNKYIVKKEVKPSGEVSVVWKETPIVERPEVKNKDYSFLYLITGIIFGTILLLLLIKFKKTTLWKIWYFLAIMITLSVSITAFINKTLSFILSLILAYYKTFKKNIILHNLTEPFVYAGIAAIFVPLFNVKSAIILLVLISIYDYIAVNKIKHMITLAEFQASQQNFAGIFIPYKRQGEQSKLDKQEGQYEQDRNKKKHERKYEEKHKEYKRLSKGLNKGLDKVSYETSNSETSSGTAILGGGDIALPMIFVGTVLKDYSMSNAIIVILTTTMALLFLLLISKKKRYYPAMPFLTVGCFVGFIISLWLFH